MHKGLMLTLIVFVLTLQMASATKIYMTSTVITQQVGGNTYWSADESVGSGSGTSTRVSHSQGGSSTKFYSPGRSSSSSGNPSSAPVGYGWATDVDLAGDIPAGTWSFKITTRSSRSEDSGGRVSVNVFKTCAGTNTQLFLVQGTTETSSSTANITQVITSSQPGFTSQGCRLKFEFWQTIANIAEDTTTTLQYIGTSNFYVDFPTPSGAPSGSCSDGQTQQASCGIGACHASITQTCIGGQWSPVCTPGNPTTEICDNIDNNCNGAVDDGIAANPSTCGIGACLRTISQTCSYGVFGPACLPGSPSAELCDGIDNNCNGQADEGIAPRIQTCGSGSCLKAINQTCSGGSWGPACVPDPICVNNASQNNSNQNLTGACTPGQIQLCGSAVGACRQGNQTCQANGQWGICTGGINPTSEICNNIDDNCNGQVDDGIASAVATCGIGACKTSVAQSCITGALSPLCTPLPAGVEICNGIDDNCNGQVDEQLVQSCGNGAGACRQGTQTCTDGEWGDCSGMTEPANETCDGLDNDCNGKVDEGTVCRTAVKPCSENWTCGNWSACSPSKESLRICTDSNSCNTSAMMPVITRLCIAAQGNATLLESVDKPVDENKIFIYSLLGLTSILLLISFIVTKAALR